MHYSYLFIQASTEANVLDNYNEMNMSISVDLVAICLVVIATCDNASYIIALQRSCRAAMVLHTKHTNNSQKLIITFMHNIIIN